MIISMQQISDRSESGLSKSIQKKPNGANADLRGRVLSRLAGSLLFAVTIASPSLQAQLAYDHTSFLNGLGLDPTVWTATYADLNTSPVSYLSQRIILKTIGLPNVDIAKRYNGQVSDIAAFLTQGGQHVLMGHSLGSLVARGAYVDNPGIRPDVAAIVAITGPHQGAPLADNFVVLRSFLRDMERRIDDAKFAIAIETAVLTNLLSVFVPGKQTTGLGPSIVAFLLINTSNIGIDVSNLDQFGAPPAVTDLSPTSAAVTHLNSSFDDGAIPRANIFGTIPFRNAPLRLLQSFQDKDADFDHMVTWRNIAQELFSSCKWFGYVTIVQWNLGRRCAYARKVLSRLDDRWVKYVNGSDANGNGRNVPFDGVVPNDHSVYPSTNGLTFNQPVNGINHLNVYKTQRGLDQVANAMARVGMQVNPNAPPPGMSSANITGPVGIDPEVATLWQGSVSGGTGGYDFQWSVDGEILQDSADPNFSYTSHTPNSQFVIQLQVTDQAGQSVMANLQVFVAAGCGKADSC